MMEIKGLAVAEKIKADIKEKMHIISQKGIDPKLAVFRVGEREDDIAYEKRLIKNAKELGISVERILIGDCDSFEKFQHEFSTLNDDKGIHGIILFRPLKNKVWEEYAKNNINPDKDVDCMGYNNLAKPYLNKFSGILPATPSACMEILKYYNITLKGKKVSIINRSTVLGKPLGMMLLNEDATVTFCHSKTENLKEITKNSDIVITGIGKAGYFDESYFNDNSVIIDVGINFDDDGMVGDVKRNMGNKVRAVTPVPGGVGIVTSSILFRNLLCNIDI